MGLRKFLIKRLIIAVALFFVILIFNFFIFRLPIFVLGMNPMSLYTTPQMDPLTIESLRILYGIPPADATWVDWFNHFIIYMQNMLTLEFGESFSTHAPVVDEIMARIPNTLYLMVTSTILAIALGIVVGVIAASRHGGKLDTALITISLSLNSFPVFWLGMMMLLFFAFYFPIFPLGHSTSWPPPTNPIIYFLDISWHMFLPVLTLTLAFFGGYMLLMRNMLVEVLTEDYILTAKAKGIPERQVLFNHGIRNAFLPLITVITISFGYVISGATLTETVFAWFGMGRLLFESLTRYDWPLSQAIFWLIAVSIIAANILADVLYGILDPRIKYS